MVLCRNFLGLLLLKHWKIRTAYRQWRSNLSWKKKKTKIWKVKYSVTTGRFAKGRFWPSTWKISYVGTDKVRILYIQTWAHCCLCYDSTHFFTLAPTHFIIFFRGLSIVFFSFIHKSAFLVSKGLLCCRYEISLLVFHIYARPCIILYLHGLKLSVILRNITLLVLETKSLRDYLFLTSK